MSIRDTLNKNPVLAGCIAGGGLLIAIILYFSLVHVHVPDASRAYFTVDDGATYFADEVSKVPPFDASGGQAVRCYVYKCNGTTWVNYLERYTASGKRKMEQIAVATPGDIDQVVVILPSDIEVKKPGAASKWIKRSDNKKGEVDAITRVKAPPGAPSDAEVTEVLP